MTAEIVTHHPPEIDLDGHVDRHGIKYTGMATYQQDTDKWTCLAAVGECLCIVEVSVRFLAGLAEGPT